MLHSETNVSVAFLLWLHLLERALVLTGSVCYGTE
jgi:hypothetical protein